jgi:hypothetical protein
MIATPKCTFSTYLKTALLRRDVRLDEADLDDLASSMLPRASKRLGEALAERLTDTQQLEMMRLAETGDTRSARELMTSVMPNFDLVVCEQLFAAAIDIAAELDAELVGGRS